jgi:hypothetical protein
MLTVRDRAGALWSNQGIPRLPRLSLAFAEAPDHAEDRVFLLTGTASADLLDDLADPPLRAATQHALVPLTVQAHGRELTVEPEQALSPGTPYALVFTRGAEPASVFPVRVSTSPAAGARLADTWPGDRDLRVPSNATRFLLRFDGYVQNLDAAHVSLRHAGGDTLASELGLFACDQLALPAGDCAEITLAQPLEPGSACELVVAQGLIDATGAPLPARTLAFSTANGRDDAPPALSAIPCALDEQALEAVCVVASEHGASLRGLSDEPALVTVLAGNTRSATLALSGAFALEVSELEAREHVPIVLRLEDLAGNARELPLTLALPAALAQVAIDEVRADPLGPEPAQEYVELLNLGSDPLQIMGFSLTDDALSEGRRIVTPLELAAGERVLVVAPDFDVTEPSDGELPPGVRIARLEGALSLRNDGEALFLRDPSGTRVAESPRMAPTSEGQCIARVIVQRVGIQPMATGDAFEYMPDPAGSCTPGGATSEASP